MWQVVDPSSSWCVKLDKNLLSQNMAKRILSHTKIYIALLSLVLHVNRKVGVPAIIEGKCHTVYELHFAHANRSAPIPGGVIAVFD